MSASAVGILRLVLILAGVLSFAYSLNTGNIFARYVAIALVALALILRIVSRLSKPR